MPAIQDGCHPKLLDVLASLVYFFNMVTEVCKCSHLWQNL